MPRTARQHLARQPVAFRGTSDAHRFDARERMRKDAARLVDMSDAESCATILGVTPLQWIGADETLTVTTPARDSRGRRNPRMVPSTYTI